MFGKTSVSSSRVEELVKTVRPEANLGPVSEDFRVYQDKLDLYLSQSLAQGTENQYFTAFQRFSKFCVENNFIALPSDPTVIMVYFVKLAEEANSAAPVLMMRSALRHYNLINRPDCTSPTDRPDVSSLVNSLVRKFGKPVKKSEPTTVYMLKLLVDKLLQGDQHKFFNFKCSTENWQVVAKTVVKFHTLSRWEEVRELKRSHFKFLTSGDLEVTFMKAKNNQHHDARLSIIAKNDGPYCPVNIVKKYFLKLNCDENIDFYFLPRFFKGTVKFEQRTSYAYCSRKFKEAVKLIGFDPSKFGEHSDRAGGFSAAANAGCSPFDLQAHGRWNSLNAPMLYHKKSLAKKKVVSSVLGNL